MDKKATISLIALLLSALLSCRSTSLHLSVSGDNYPAFKVGGTDALYSFWVQEYDPKTQKRVGDYLWSFEKKFSAPRALTLWQIGGFKYGDTPSEAYNQQTPRDTARPQPLEEGKWYKAEIFTADKDACQVIFQIEFGKVSNAKMIYIDDNNKR